MAFTKIKKVILYLIAAGLIAYLIYNTFFEPNILLKDAHIKWVSITIFDLKAGLQPTKVESKTTTDEQEIDKVVSALKKPLLYKKFPSIGGVRTSSNDRLEMSITLVSDNSKVFEYLIDSEGYAEIRRENSSFNAGVLGRSNIIWFEQLKKLYDSKNQNEKWS